MGWVTSELPGGDHLVIKVELKGPENTLRVRQVKVMGWKEGESIKIAGQISASVAQQKNCEAETLRVFRLITSQVRCSLWSTLGLLTSSRGGHVSEAFRFSRTPKLRLWYLLVVMCAGVWEADLWRC